MAKRRTAPSEAQRPLVFFGDPRLPERFWSKVEPQDDGCWLWLAYRIPANYGQWYDGVRVTNSHAAAFRALVGPVPNGMELHHLCHDEDPTCREGDWCQHRACCNPSHLEALPTSRNRSKTRPSAPSPSRGPRPAEVNNAARRDGRRPSVLLDGVRYYLKESHSYYIATAGMGGSEQSYHRAVWGKANGRPVPEGHVIHHRDHNKFNNDPSNLEAIPWSEHSRYHCYEQKETTGRWHGAFGYDSQDRHEARKAEWARKPMRTVWCEICGAEDQTRAMVWFTCSEACRQERRRRRKLGVGEAWKRTA